MEEILTSLLPGLANRGAFGIGKYSSLRWDEDRGKRQYSTEVTMLKLRLKVNSCDSVTLPIVVKSQIPNARRRRDIAIMFRNEVAMYNTILPFLNDSSSPYPKIYHGVANGVEDYDKDVLIVENLKYSGFAHCRDKLYLDFNHVTVAIRRLAELHSWSFIKKERDGKTFIELVGKLQKIVRVRGDEDFDFDKMNYLSLKRGIEPLIPKQKSTKILKDFLKISENIPKLYKVLQKSVEPFGVVVHGDYCKNNLMFKYDYKGRPTDCSYLDFQLSTYGSPAVDLSFFLYMHTSPEARETHWDTFLRFYWTTVRENVLAEIDLPSFEEFEEHFATKAAYAYVVCSFYLPSLLEDKVITNDEFSKLSTGGKMERLVNSAGEEGQKSISDIFQHMLTRNYITKFLNYYAKNT